MIDKVETRDISIANLTVGGGSPIELIEAAAASGFGKVGLLLQSAMQKPLTHEIVGRPEVIREIKAACKANNVSIFDVEAFVLSPVANLDLYRTNLAVGAELGATHISTIGTELLTNDVFLTEQHRIDLFGGLCDAAAEFDLQVGLEFMLYRDVGTIRHATTLLNAVGRKNAGIILDALHFHRSGASLEDLDIVPVDRFAYVQLCDAGLKIPALDRLAVEARTARLHVGDGALPLNSILDRVPEGVQLVIETPVQADAALTSEQKLMRAAEATRRFFSARFLETH